jgi:hypothetical protein
MNKNIKILLCLFLIIPACDAILEQDISNKEIVVKTPSDELITRETQHIFWWNCLKGASAYEVMIVSPDMENPIMLVLDSVVTVNRLQYTLPVGDYEWCVRGSNSGYSTEYFCRTLTVIE